MGSSCSLLYGLTHHPRTRCMASGCATVIRGGVCMWGLMGDLPNTAVWNVLLALSLRVSVCGLPWGRDSKDHAYRVSYVLGVL